MFRPRWWGALLASGALVAGIALGDWQMRRAEERRAIAERHAAGRLAPPVDLNAHRGDMRALAMRRVVAAGAFLPGYALLLDQRVRAGRVGYEVVTPMRLHDDGRAVLVLRGWIAASPRRDELPEVVTPQGRVTVEGVALEGIAQRYAPHAESPVGQVWQNLRIEDARARTGLDLLPILIEQHSPSADGLDRRWPIPGSGAEKNEMYALQWYSLAALAVVLWIVLSFRRDAPAAE